MLIKRCPTCKRDLPATHEYYHHCKITRDHLYGTCKECNREKKNAYMLMKRTDPDKLLPREGSFMRYVKNNKPELYKSLISKQCRNK